MEPFLATVIMFGPNWAPRGWALCEGQILPINSNQSLYSLLGTTFGGDGRTSFALPDLRGRVPIGAGDGSQTTSRSPGQKIGEEAVTLDMNDLPAHNHALIPGDATLTGGVTVGINEEGVDASNPTSGTFTEANMYSSSTPTNNYAHMSHNLVLNGDTSLVGGGQSHNNMQPFLAISYLIAIQGLFPSRN